MAVTELDKQRILEVHKKQQKLSKVVKDLSLQAFMMKTETLLQRLQIL